MFSHRITRNVAPNGLTLALERRRESGGRILDLTESNPTLSGFDYNELDIARALSQPGIMRYEPHPKGTPTARNAITAYYQERGVKVDPESFILASGTSEAYGYLFKLLADPGSDILVPVPGYPLLEVLTSLEEMQFVPYRSLYDEQRGWLVDMERLANTISNRTKAIVVVSPNNPTGSFLKKDELDVLEALCQTFGLALIVDEVFSDYGCTSDHARVQSAAAHGEVLTFTLNGLSKIVGLPQLKLAWVYVSGPNELRHQALEGLEFIADAYLSVSTPVQLATNAIFGGRSAIQSQILKRLEVNSHALEEAFRAAVACRILRREGGWYAVVRLPDEASDEEICLRSIEQDGVLVHPGYFYDFPSGNHLVLSLLTSPEVFHEGTQLLARLLAKQT
jgi:hypothetical protein